MSENISLERAAELIEAARVVAVITHENPDGDATGSVVGMMHCLRALGKQATAFFAAPPAAMYRPFADIEIVTSASQKQLEAADLVLQLDTATPARIAVPAGLTVDDRLPLLVIDHHTDNKLFGCWNCVRGSAACCEILYDLAKLAGWNIPANAATAFLLGIMADTGGFRFSNTTTSALAAGAELLQRSGRYFDIIDSLFFNQSLERKRFEAELLNSHLELFFDGRLAIVKIPSGLSEKYNLNPAHCEGLIDAFRSISGVETVAMLYKRAPEQVKVSMRARNPERPVGPIARKLGGGGHEMAAGGLIATADLDALATRIIELYKETL
ncbi:MAG: bifunctional oligoribonuclease/PAP phosphatase NrnA [Victivallaceae bacterium]|nr:DHH family phosphoesterase [Victivallaceae bacterium]